jgi:hypothetical protein
MSLMRVIGVVLVVVAIVLWNEGGEHRATPALLTGFAGLALVFWGTVGD